MRPVQPFSRLKWTEFWFMLTYLRKKNSDTAELYKNKILRHIYAIAEDSLFLTLEMHIGCTLNNFFVKMF